jgi:hypothetical protein
MINEGPCAQALNKLSLHKKLAKHELRVTEDSV